MKFTFLKLKNVVQKPADTNDNAYNEQALASFEQHLPLPDGPIQIAYTFLCNNGRHGDYFATKLAEDGDNVAYYRTTPQQYEITGCTEVFKSQEAAVRNRLTALIEAGTAYSCMLNQWNIIKK